LSVSVAKHRNSTGRPQSAPFTKPSTYTEGESIHEMIASADLATLEPDAGDGVLCAAIGAPVTLNS
jgi:hypothetical protein